MPRFSKFFVVLVCILGCYTGLMAQKNDFVWGINGHPLTQYEYRQQTWNEQLAFLRDLKLNHYRIDIPLNEKGLAKRDVSLNELIKKLKIHNISPMLVVFPREDKMEGDSANVYQSYFSQGKNFAQRYAQFTNVVEVGNEWDLKVMIKNPHLDGTKSSHYQLTAAKNRMWLLAGFIDGLKSVRPSLKVSLSLTWTHWYYLDLLKQNQIDYDIIGYHWYSSMGDITKVRAPYGNILPMIKSKYNKEIWVTEFNTYVGTKNASFEKQKDYIQRNLKELLNQKIIGGFFIYELFDQPNLRPRYPKEADYGLIYRKGQIYKKKPAYFVYKKIIEGAK